MDEVEVSIDNYVATVPFLKYLPVDEKVWDAIKDEGLDEELGSYNKQDWHFAELNLTEKDKLGLKSVDQDTIEKFNKFDIKLKNRFKLVFIDLIDYEKGEVIIVVPFWT